MPQSEPHKNQDPAKIDASALQDLEPEVLETIGLVLAEAKESPEQIRRIRAELKYSKYTGSFAPAEIVAEYEAAFPGAGRWILDQTALQSERRHELEKIQVQGAEARMGRGQWIAGAIALGGLICAPITVWLGASWPVPVGIVALAVGGPVAGQAFVRLMAVYIERRR